MYTLKPFEFSYSSSEKKLFSTETIILSENKTYAIVGPSGSGKSTLLKILKGIIPEYSSGELKGEITYQEKKLTGDDFRENLKKIVYLFQNPFSQLIYPEVEEELLFSMENFNYSTDEIDAKVSDLNQLFNLEKLWGKQTKQLSNGECQKLVLASLLAINPEVLLMDEPTAFLDPESRQKFYEILKKIKNDKILVIVDHYVDEIKSLVDAYLVVNEHGFVKLQEEYSPFVASDDFNEPLKLHEVLSQKKIELKIQNLWFSYENKINLFSDLNFMASGGDVICIKGNNGEGKSTLFKLMSGILKPVRGQIDILINDKKLNLKEIIKEVGFVFQNPENHFYFDTVKEELMTPYYRSSQSKIKNDLIARFFHSLNLEKSPFLLSEGEKRRLSILMTILLDKRIIFYDEPTFGQDEKSIDKIIQIFGELKNKGYLQIFISHDDKFINKVATKVFELKEGVLNETSS